jgi:hypothetical protein
MIGFPTIPIGPTPRDSARDGLLTCPLEAYADISAAGDIQQQALRSELAARGGHFAGLSEQATYEIRCPVGACRGGFPLVVLS